MNPSLVRYSFSDLAVLRNVVPLTAALGLFLISARGLRRSVLLRATGRSPGQPARAPDPGARGELGRRLVELLEKERLYVDPSLTVATLAGRAAAPRAEVSACLNQELGVPFHDFVSGYRVEEAKRLLRDPRLAHLTVEAIGRRAGFGTRSTFHQRFRDRVGMTPSAYRLSE